ncbi:hypothetical protein ACHAXA_002163 [Cyclostephanos tholiformis]|uniref:Cyclin N-terminal domain-containing protein n=1 Tax=Cyclostephanos tholiformis TaxID=382380 RepID=A0ABD3R9A6_9STRA
MTEFLRDAAGMTQQTLEILYTTMKQDFAFSYHDYLNNEEDLGDFTDTIGLKVAFDDRAKIVDWCYSVIDMCELDREHVARAMNIVDRFMSNPHRPPRSEILPHFSHREILYDRNMYQLLAVSALYISIKVNEREIFSAENIATMSQGNYSAANIEAMERTILECLSWRVCAPTAFQLGCIVIELMISQVQESTDVVMDIGRWNAIRNELAFQTESAVRDFQLAAQRPSSVAYMALINTIEVDKNMKNSERYLLMKTLANIFLEVKNLSLTFF